MLVEGAWQLPIQLEHQHLIGSTCECDSLLVDAIALARGSLYRYTPCWWSKAGEYDMYTVPIPFLLALFIKLL